MEERFSRNIPAISPEAQEKLRNSHVCIAGCGGLGGYLIEFLARAGVGRFTVIDADRFEPSNLNRQCLSTLETLDTVKSDAAAKRIAAIDPSIHIRTEQTFLDAANAENLLQGADLVMDALDSAASRLVLTDACRKLRIPLIHGAIGGWNAQISVCMPEDSGLAELYQRNAVSEDKSCLSFTPALCAALQCAEAVKLLTGTEPALKSRLLLADLRYMDFVTIDL